MRGDTFGPLSGARALTVSHDARAEASCFADEVAIDFPLVAFAVDRIRRGLVADEPPARWSTTIHVSEHDARRGTTVPLDVPMRLTCRHCGGRGESWSEPCRHCDGSGVELVHRGLQVSVPAGVLDGERFHFTVTFPQHTPARIELRVLVG